MQRKPSPTDARRDLACHLQQWSSARGRGPRLLRPRFRGFGRQAANIAVDARPRCCDAAGNHDPEDSNFGQPYDYDGGFDVGALSVFPYCRCDTYQCEATPYSLVYAGQFPGSRPGTSQICYDLLLVRFLHAWADASGGSTMVHH
eukprot:364730-Chlamydomonas_euryale.AAC.1